MSLVPAALLASARRGARRQRAAGVFSGYTFLSMDYHTAPTHDLKHVFAALCHATGACNTVEEHSLSGSCGSAARLGAGDPLRSTCAAPGSLGPVTRENGFDLCPAPHALRRAFFAATRSSYVRSLLTY